MNHDTLWDRLMMKVRRAAARLDAWTDAAAWAIYVAIVAVAGDDEAD